MSITRTHTMLSIRATGLLIALTVVIGLGSQAAAQSLSETEQQIADYVDAHNDEAIDFLERTVNMNSGTMNHDGIRALAEVYRAELDALGFETRWVSLPDSVNRAGHLFATRAGDRGRRLLLIGHLDTVFEEDSPFQRFERQSDTLATGPAVNDMKGGNAMVIYALKALDAAGALDGAHITVAFTGDEEKPGRPISVSRAALIEAAQESDVALGFETASGMDYATIARRGSSGWTLRVQGRQAHSSGIFSEDTGSGAVFEAARILDAFHEDVRGEEFLTFNPGILLGGTDVSYDASAARGTAYGKTNVVAKTVVVDGGLRFISDEQKEAARDQMRAIVAGPNRPQTSAEITFEDAYPAMQPTDGNRALLTVLDQVSRDLGQGPVKAYDPGARGAADISFIAKYVDGMDGLGVMGSGAHSLDETINLRTFPLLTQRAALLIHRLTRE
jgi:glutamate carboxypeptidase